MEPFLEYNLDLTQSSSWETVSATAASKASLLYLQEAGDFHCGPDYNTSREGISSYMINLTVSGCGQLEYDGQHYIIPPGHLFWIDCRKFQRYYTHQQTGNWHNVWVHFWGANAQFYYDMFLTQNENVPVASLAPSSPVYQLITSLLQQSEAGNNQQKRDFHNACLLTQLLTECTLSLIQHNLPDDIPQTIQAVRFYLLQNFRKKITLDMLGKQFNVNPFYLQKQFKQYIGQSPTEFMIYLRMTKAKELLRTSNKPVGEVARSVGIDNLGYFTRQFKQHEGMTPMEYCKVWPTIIGNGPIE